MYEAEVIGRPARLAVWMKFHILSFSCKRSVLGKVAPWRDEGNWANMSRRKIGCAWRVWMIRKPFVCDVLRINCDASLIRDYWHAKRFWRRKGVGPKMSMI